MSQIELHQIDYTIKCLDELIYIYETEGSAGLREVQVDEEIINAKECLCYLREENKKLKQQHADVKSELAKLKSQQSFTKIGEFAGYVDDVQGDTFQTRLTNLDGNPEEEELISTFDKTDLSESDQLLLNVGNVVDVDTGYIDYHGKRYRAMSVSFVPNKANK